MTRHCFTYGSLMWADIMSRVVGAPVSAEPAWLDGHARHPVRGEDYPGLQAAPGQRVEGRLYRDLGDAAWPRLDAFEGAEYERMVVQVEVAGGRREAAWVYRFRGDPAARLLPGDWDVSAFEREGRARFLSGYAGFSAIDPA